jgi:hypothetical protein
MNINHKVIHVISPALIIFALQVSYQIAYTPRRVTTYYNESKLVLVFLQPLFWNKLKLFI